MGYEECQRRTEFQHRGRSSGDHARCRHENVAFGLYLALSIEIVQTLRCTRTHLRVMMKIVKRI